MEELKAFLQLPHIHKADEWLELFHSEPPRGVLVRLARRLSVDLTQQTNAGNTRR